MRLALGCYVGDKQSVRPFELHLRAIEREAEFGCVEGEA